MAAGPRSQHGRRADRPAVQLALGGADTLVAALAEGCEPLPRRAAAGLLFALRSAPPPLVDHLLDEVVGEDARLVALPGGLVGLAEWRRARATPLEASRFTVVDLETTGVGPSARIVEIGAVRLEGLREVARLERLVDPGVPLPPAIERLTGIGARDLRGAGHIRPALEELLALATGSVLVAHNARFDVGMLDRALTALEGRRLALPVLDTVGLARRLLSGRLARFDLATLADRFSTSVRPCHRALPDALATAELLAALAGRAQERGVDTVEGLIELSEAPVRRVRTRRHLSDAAPRGPGVYVMRDAHGQALYVGKASDLRSRTRSYFGSRRQKPSLEAALLALDRIDTAPLGSELEAALAEIELIQAWRPPANVRDARPDRAVYLRLGLADPYPALGVRGQVRPDGALYAGPLRSKRVADEAATALRDAFALRTCRPRLPVDDGSCLRGLLGRCAAPCRGAPHDVAYADGVERLRLHLEGRGEGASAALAERGAALIAERRFEEAARLRTRRQALASLEATLAQIRRARTRSGLLLAPDLDPAAVRVLAVREGALAGSWAVPRRGDPSAALAPALASLEPPRPPEGPAELDPPGPWLPAERHGAALLLAAALAGRDAGVVAQPLLAGTRREDLVRRAGESRVRVALRAPLGPGRHRRWRELAALEPPQAASALSA